jgi:hypothetical protein
MNKIIIGLIAFAVSGAAFADHYVQGHARKDGTYVQGHMAADPNQNRYDNLSSQSRGGAKRDEFSTYGATNKNNSGYGLYDNDRDGLSNNLDPRPESKCNYGYGC